MADATDQTIDVNIWDDARTKAVDVITEGSNERLACDSFISNTPNVMIAGGSTRPPITMVYEDNGSVTNQTVITPTSGKYLDIYSLHVSTNDTGGGKFVVKFLTSGITLLVDFSKNGGNSAFLVNFQGAVNEVLSITTTGISPSKDWAVSVGYQEL